MEQILLQLLKRLEAIGEEHKELYDSDVREAMDDAVFYGFIKPRPGYALPDAYAMFSADGNRLVREALEEYITAARALAPTVGVNTFHERLAAFQDLKVRTAHTNDYNDFFGWSDPKQFDSAGNVK